MSTIDWATGQSGTWTTAADWSGGVVPGPSDTAVIDAASKRHYTITLNSAVTVGGIVLDQANAVLEVSSSLTSPAIDLEAGTLALTGATLAGTITDTGGAIQLGKGDTVLDNVTLAGAVDVGLLKRSGNGTLTIHDGLTVTGANGSGAGTAAFACRLVLDGINVLDNATISDSSTSGILFEGSTKLTLGSHLDLTARDFLLKAGQSVTNDGTLSAEYMSGGTLTNDGTILETDPLDLIAVTSLTNNGLISAAGEFQLSYQGLNAPGAGGAIELDGGALVLDGTLTTAQLLATFAAQHVTGTGAYGFGVVGALDNSATTLTVGTGTTLGTLNTLYVTGSTIIDHGGSSIDGSMTSLAYDSSSSTLSVGYLTWTDVDLTGVTSLLTDGNVTIQGGILSGVGTLTAGFLNLDGTDITGAGNSGQVLITMDPGSSVLDVAANQSVAGYTVDFTADRQLFEVQGGAALNNATLNFGPTGTYGDDFAYGYGNGGVSLGAHFDINIATGAYVILSSSAPPAPLLTSQGTMAIAGTLALGGNNAVADLDNTGVIDISSGGTFLAGSDHNDILSNSGVIAATDATLDLAAVTNSGEISATFKAAPGTAGIGGALSGSGTVALSGAGTLALGGTVAAGQLVSLGSGAETMHFTSKTADTGFGGSIGGFAKGDSIAFSGETLTAASFAGQSIVATLSTGGTIALATNSALTGELSVTNAKGVATITYTDTELSGHGWPGAALAANTLTAHWEPLAFDHGGSAWVEEKSWAWPIITHGH